MTKYTFQICLKEKSHSASLSLPLTVFYLLQGKAVRMMGVLEDEVNEVLQNAKVDLRIAGFDEEAKRLRQKISNRPYTSHKLPQGPYIFCDFRTLSLPGVEVKFAFLLLYLSAIRLCGHYCVGWIKI